MEFHNLKARYEVLFGQEPTAPDTMSKLESALGVSVPEDMRSISTFFSGGMIGGISHNSLSPDGPASNIAETTLRFRKAVGFPNSFIVLAELDESIVVLNTTADSTTFAVEWLNNYSIDELIRDGCCVDSDKWCSYSSWFDYLVSCEEKQRQSNWYGK